MFFILFIFVSIVQCFIFSVQSFFLFLLQGTRHRGQAVWGFEIIFGLNTANVISVVVEKFAGSKFSSLAREEDGTGPLQ